MADVAGSSWRFLAHGKAGPVSLDSTSTPAVFDELVVDHWLHIEQMDVQDWWLRIDREDGSAVVINIGVGRRGRADAVVVETEAAVVEAPRPDDGGKP